MFDAQHSKRSEPDRTQTTPEQKSANPKQGYIHQTGDLTRIPAYAQVWGNQPPPWLRLPAQRKDLHEEQPLQEKDEPPIQRKKNTTGLPDTLRAGAESLSSLSMDDVQVHYNSSQPAEVQALAYTQRTDIYVGPGQEQHLAHEAWHVVQQKQGRVQPTLQAKDVAINDDLELEREADVMGEKMRYMHGAVIQQVSSHSSLPHSVGVTSAIIQRVTWTRPKIGTIWSPDLGRAYEIKKGANIAGNYPIIDDFQPGTGTATSFKAMDLINNYQGPNGPTNLSNALNAHVNALLNFYPKTPSTRTGITIDRKDVKHLVLQIAIPPRDLCPPELLTSVGTAELWKIPPDSIAINQSRQKSTRSTPIAPDKDVTTTLSIVIEPRNDLPWGPSPGLLYERLRKANIAGNFPTIDDYQPTTYKATSLKTINLVENYPSWTELKRTVEGYIEELASFQNGKAPLGSTQKVDRDLVQNINGKDYIVVQNVKERELRLAIPNIQGKQVIDSAGKFIDLRMASVEGQTEEGQILHEKYNYMAAINGSTIKTVKIVVEAVD